MKSHFDITVLRISTRSPDEWLKRFSEFLSREIKNGVWIRGWPELNLWLKTPPDAALPNGCIERLESTAREMDSDVVVQTISRDLTHLYLVNKTDELRAFLWTSWSHCDFPLVLFPASCSHDDEAAILSATDTLGVASYATLRVGASWFATVNLEGTDEPLVCFASKDSDRTESLRRDFCDTVLPEGVSPSVQTKPTRSSLTPG
jgi:hypothetical protein